LVEIFLSIKAKSCREIPPMLGAKPLLKNHSFPLFFFGGGVVKPPPCICRSASTPLSALKHYVTFFTDKKVFEISPASEMIKDVEHPPVS